MRPVMAYPGLASVRLHPGEYLEGRARSRSGRHGKILAGLLQSDVQGDLATAQALLTEIAAAERGEAPQPGGVGNAFSITITADGTVICNAAVEHAAPERYSLDELRTALETWIAAIITARRGGA
jgi:hypothetical protein